MATNPFDQFDAPAANPFDQFDVKAPAMASSMPGPRKNYALSEVPGQAISNIPASAKRFAGGLYEAITSPIQTAKGVLDIGAGALQKALPESAVNFINQFEGNPAAAARACSSSPRSSSAPTPPATPAPPRAPSPPRPTSRSTARNRTTPPGAWPR